VNYNIEGSDIGYRWNARQGHKALFPFGYGLSYTSFERTELAVSGLDASFTIANTGPTAGADVAQLYLTRRPSGAKQRLVGFKRVELAAGRRETVRLTIDPRLIADWTGDGWKMEGGTYDFALGADAERLGPTVSVRLPARRWKQ
jgi:beta-glucosidase